MFRKVNSPLANPSLDKSAIAKHYAMVTFQPNTNTSKKVAFGMTVALLGLSQQALAHVEYYDLNQGAQISDLSAAGKIASTTQYGATSAAVVALGNIAANGLGVISDQSDRPLNNTALWNTTNQAYTGVGSFTGVTYTPTSSSATVDVDDVTDFGWGAGTQAVLGDSHKVDFFNFRLSEASTVNISWNVDDGAGSFIDNGFTLYSGLLQYQGHDDAPDKLNPKVGPVNKVQNALDSASAPADVQGITSSYRNTTASGPGTYVGQYNSLANWGQSNVSGQWGNIAVLKAVNANTGAASTDGFSVNASDAIETLRIVLGAGNYTIGASGALGAIANKAAGTLGGIDSFGSTNLHGRLTFSARAVHPISNFISSPASLTVGSTSTVSANPSADFPSVPLVFTTTTPTICSIIGSTTVSADHVGICTIAANQPGHPESAPRPPQITLAITIKGTPILSFITHPSVLKVKESGTVMASSTSSGSVTISSTKPSICSVTANQVTGLAVGDCIIAANQAGNADYLAATEVTQTIAISKGSQTISFGQQPNLVVGVYGLLSANSDSGLGLIFTTSTPDVCTVAGNQITGVSAGSCAITASQEGDLNYEAALPVTQGITITLDKSSQVITFTNLSPINVGESVVVSVSADSTLAVSLSAAPANVCVLNNHTITAIGAGSCSLTASQAGNASYLAAADVPQLLTINKGTQTLVLGAAPLINLGESGVVSATGNPAGLAVYFSSSTPEICSVSGQTVTAVNAGDCIIVAHQDANDNYSAANPISQSITISKLNQAISFGPAPTLSIVSPGTLSATSSASLEVVFSSLSANICSVNGNQVTAITAGTCIIAANQAGNNNYLAAAQVTQSITISKLGQIISFGPAPKIEVGKTAGLSVTTNAGLLGITLISKTPGVCGITNGKLVKGLKVGSCTVEATQTGNFNYLAATNANSFPISKGTQQIVFSALKPLKKGLIRAISAKASSNLVVKLISKTPLVCKFVTANIVNTRRKAGICSISGSQPGNVNYKAAPVIVKSFRIIN